MRPIKFKGKTNSDKWVYGSLVYSDNIHPAIYFEVGEGSVKSLDYAIVDPKTIGQFTGLYDCTPWEALSPYEHDYYISLYGSKLEYRGREIYEGDILSWDYADNNNVKDWMKKACFVVTFSSTHFWGKGLNEKLYLHGFRFKYTKVVGNIHNMQ